MCINLNANVGVQGIYSGVFDHSVQRIAQHTHTTLPHSTRSTDNQQTACPCNCIQLYL